MEGNTVLYDLTKYMISCNTSSHSTILMLFTHTHTHTCELPLELHEVWGLVVPCRVPPVISKCVRRGHLTHAHTPVTMVSCSHHPAPPPLLRRLLHHSCPRSHLVKFREGHPGPHPQYGLQNSQASTRAGIGWGNGGAKGRL